MLNEGTTVRFAEDLFTALLEQGRPFPEGIAQLRATQSAGMTVQGTLPNGRVNVKFMSGGYMQYRTFSPRDLVTVA